MIVSFSFIVNVTVLVSLLVECFGPVPSYIPFVVCVYEFYEIACRRAW